MADHRKMSHDFIGLIRKGFPSFKK